MPRQISLKKIALKGRVGASPVPVANRRPRVGKAVARRNVEDSKVNNIAKMSKSLAKSGMIAEPDKNNSMKDVSRALFSSIGAGVATHVEPDSVSHERGKKRVKLKTSYSLLKSETDRTVIPNQNITDLKSVKNQLSAKPMISARHMFENFDENTIFAPRPQEAIKRTVKRQQVLKAEGTSNLIDIAGDLIDFQNDLKSDVKLESFKYTQKVNSNPSADNQNHEFKDFSDPNLFWDDDDEDDDEY
tara:strand:- start:1843 stop:2577 length:735 start_codon:yes stop_codon:yes gene_type:complete